MDRVVVVGAGLSGLACAYRLDRAGIPTTVLERAEAPGGRAQTERRSGYVVDTGPDAMTAGYTHYVALLEELGMGDRVVHCSPVMGLVRDGKLHDLNLERRAKLAFTRALSVRARLRTAAGYLGVRRMLHGIDPYELVGSFELDDPDRSAYEFGLDRFGAEVADYVVDPAMRLVTTVGARDASIVNLLGAIKGWMAPLINVVGGMDLLPKTLADRVDVRYGVEVGAVKDRAAGVRVTYRDPSGGVNAIEAGACVITAMYGEAVQIWPQLAHASPKFGHELRYARLIGVTLGYSVPTNSKAYVVQVPTIESREGLLMLMQHNKAPDRAPAGHSLVTVYTDTPATERWLDRPDEELEDWAASLAESWCPELAGKRDMALVSRWPRTAYLPEPGYWRRTAALIDALPRDGRVQIAGDLFNGSSMESAIRWGESAAARVAERLQRGQGRPVSSAQIPLVK
jgi:protoporphyrinogen/coproporphyrinogen III oxidase